MDVMSFVFGVAATIAAQLIALIALIVCGSAKALKSGETDKENK